MRNSRTAADDQIPDSFWHQLASFLSNDETDYWKYLKTLEQISPLANKCMINFNKMLLIKPRKSSGNMVPKFLFLFLFC